MKITKKIISYVLAFITVFSSFTILPSELFEWADVSAVNLTTENSNSTETFTDGDFVYSLINHYELKIVEYKGEADAYIPDVAEGIECPEIANRKVTAIGKSAFSHKNISNITFGKNIKYIESYAFIKNQAIETLDLSVCKNLISIGDHAFYYNNALTTVKFPDNLKIIDDYAFAWCYKLTKVEIEESIVSIGDSAFAQCERLQTVNIKGGTNAIIGYSAFLNCYKLESVNIGNGVLRIDKSAFYWCPILKQVTIGEDVTYIGVNAFGACENLIKVDILSKEITGLYEDSITFYKNDAVIYCYKGSNTHNTLKDNGYTNLSFYEREIHTTDITVNGTSVDSFSKETKNYTVYVNDATYINVTPVFEEDDVKYTVNSNDNVYTIKVYNDNVELLDTYTVTVIEYGYTVIGDISLMLNNISGTKVSGDIALPAGTYNLKIAKGSKQFGYKKTVTDYCNGLTLKEIYSSYITLNATGGTYTFQFDTKTNKLVIKHQSNMPNEYLVGDLDVILKPVANRPLSIGTQQLSRGTYKFKVSIGGKECGYNKVLNNATVGGLTVNSKYQAYITLNATGGLYTFKLNTETNQLIVQYTPASNETKTDIHISGDFNLVMNDESEFNQNSTIATGTIYLEDGCYTFKVHNYGIVYTAGLVINDKGSCTLANKYITPVTLNATGGYYKFVFDKTTGVLKISLLD